LDLPLKAIVFDVHMDLLEPTSTVTHCPYKGAASYWPLHVGDKTYRDFVWSYPRPIPGIPKIENLLCFYNEKVDLYVDGVLRERPASPFALAIGAMPMPKWS
jgi:uncharacterized protein (DUF427 family)